MPHETTLGLLLMPLLKCAREREMLLTVLCHEVFADPEAQDFWFNLKGPLDEQGEG